MQESEVFALKLEDASLAAIFFALVENFIVQLYCGQSLGGKGCFKATKRDRKGLRIACLALAAILPSLMTSPYSQFW